MRTWRASVRMAWRRFAARFRGDAAQQRSRARLADELLATLDPWTLFTAGYPAHRRARVDRRRIRYRSGR